MEILPLAISIMRDKKEKVKAICLMARFPNGWIYKPIKLKEKGKWVEEDLEIVFRDFVDLIFDKANKKK